MKTYVCIYTYMYIYIYKYIHIIYIYIHTYTYTNLIKVILTFISLICLQLLDKKLTQNVTKTIVGQGPKQAG